MNAIENQLRSITNMIMGPQSSNEATSNLVNQYAPTAEHIIGLFNSITARIGTIPITPSTLGSNLT